MNYLRVGDMAKEANFVFLAIFSGGRPFFSAVFHGLVPPVNDDSIGKSGSGENLCSDDGTFLQEYFVYFKKK